MIRNCFTFCNRVYVFRDKNLFQQPYNHNNRWYNEREIKKKGNGYVIQGLYVNKETIYKLLEKKQFNEKIESELIF